MTTQAPLAIEANGLVKSFGETRAVDGVDLAVPVGSVYGVLGPNGAGKTTTIRMLATLLKPDGGSAQVLGHDIVREADAVRGLVSLTGARGLPASAMHFGALWGSDAALYAALGIAPPPWRWSARELATDMGNKAVYALATGAAYDQLAARA